ncbi:MAG: hypothetical protein ACOY5Y_17020 [Pseudomonadota bacterium]|jgi:hypothetical protein
MNAATPFRPLPESLDLVGEEMAELVVLAEHVQSVIARMARAAPPDLGTLVDAQAADLLTQRLQGLTGFVRALADAERSEDYADIERAVRALTLAEQARRLAGAAPPPVAAGEVASELTFWD